MESNKNQWNQETTQVEREHKPLREKNNESNNRVDEIKSVYNEFKKRCDQIRVIRMLGCYSAKEREQFIKEDANISQTLKDLGRLFDKIAKLMERQEELSREAEEVKHVKLDLRRVIEEARKVGLALEGVLDELDKMHGSFFEKKKKEKKEKKPEECPETLTLTALRNDNSINKVQNKSKIPQTPVEVFAMKLESLSKEIFKTREK